MNSADLYVVRFPEIHAIGHIVGAIVTAEFGQIDEIKAKYSSMEVVPISEYPEYIAGMIRSAANSAKPGHCREDSIGDKQQQSQEVSQ